MSRAVTLLVCAGALCSACGPSTRIRKEQAVTATETEKVKSKFTGPKRRIGVVEFENKSAYGQRLGTAASDILVTELSKTGKFVVVERDKLNKILDEQKLQSTGVIDPKTAVAVGKVLGLSAIVTGSVSEFGVKTEGTEMILSQSKNQIAEATVDIRIVDAETGQVLFADSGRGTAKSGKRTVLGLGARGGYDETLEGKALRASIAQFTENIVSQVNKKPWSCRVASVSGGLVYINAGPNMGIEKGRQLDCFHLGREILDPTTGLVLGNEEVPVGRIEVTGPLGDTGEGSIAQMTQSQGTALVPKDICRLVD